MANSEYPDLQHFLQVVRAVRDEMFECLLPLSRKIEDISHRISVLENIERAVRAADEILSNDAEIGYPMISELHRSIFSVLNRKNGGFGGEFLGRDDVRFDTDKSAIFAKYREMFREVDEQDIVSQSSMKQVNQAISRAQQGLASGSGGAHEWKN